MIIEERGTLIGRSVSRVSTNLIGRLGSNYVSTDERTVGCGGEATDKCRRAKEKETREIALTRCAGHLRFVFIAHVIVIHHGASGWIVQSGKEKNSVTTVVYVMKLSEGRTPSDAAVIASRRERHVREHNFQHLI